LREVAVARAVGGEQHELRSVIERDLAADDERQARVLRREMRADDARERALVGDRQRRVALRTRALDQFLRVRRAAEEREIRQAVQFGVGGEHRGLPPPASGIGSAGRAAGIASKTVQIYGIWSYPGRGDDRPAAVLRPPPRERR
jgi:hypothetical protein